MTVTMRRDPSSLSEDNYPGLTVDPVEDETSCGLHACKENANLNILGKVSDALPEEDEKEDTLCTRSRNLKVVKIKTMDLDDLSSPNSFCFSLKPFHPKFGVGLNIVTLRDPFDRLWPVMYHESIEFIGFANGWKDFTIANNIQQGNLC
ncbi:hypothetical protein MUK42_33591, partial [Musa troglodytarum]